MLIWWNWQDRRQTVDEKITPLLNYIFKLNLAEEGDHGGEGDHAEGGQEHTIVNLFNLTEKENHDWIKG